MTYPPPPGVPGDPGQQPMSDPYAPGGGYAPPPADPYGAPPPPPDPYGTPQPQVDPYGNPLQGDPYGTPPQQDPYGSPPMSGVPMSPGAPGMAPDPYTQAPMGMPGQPQPFLGGQPPKKSNVGWIVGGVGGAVVLILIVVVGIVLLNSGGSSDEAGGDGTEETSEAGGGETSAEGGGGDGSYQVTKGMCEQVDVSGVPSSLGLSGLDDISLDDEMYCSSLGSGSSSTLISIKGRAYGDATEAESGYEEYKSTETVGGDGLVDFSGDWDKGEISQYSSLEGTASVFIVDGNMAITMYISATDSATNAEAKDAATALAAAVFEVAAA